MIQHVSQHPKKLHQIIFIHILTAAIFLARKLLEDLRKEEFVTLVVVLDLQQKF
tara:strand:+ start:315 stop:476 length:162 start_codon:yes stop_codon:yes gene_type:complete